MAFSRIHAKRTRPAASLAALLLCLFAVPGCGGGAATSASTQAVSPQAPAATSTAATRAPASSEAPSSTDATTLVPPSTTSAPPSTTSAQTSTTLWPFADPGPEILDVGDGHVDGWLTSIDGTSFAVDRFVLTLPDGSSVDFVMSPGVDMSSFGSITHFYQHEAYGWPVRIYFEASEGGRTAVAIDDR